MSLALGIDIGTSGVRTAMLEGDACLLQARASHPEQSDPNRIDATAWWEAVETCLHATRRALADQGRDMADIAGIAVDGTSGSMVLTDANLNPVSPGLMYNSKGFDAEAEAIAAVAPEIHIAKGSNSALARAMRLNNLAEATPVHLLHQADFVVAKLMGRGGMSDFNNALKTGFDPETGRWPDWAEAVIDTSSLPTVHAPGEALGAVSTEVCDTFGFSAQARVYAGTTDSIAAFLAAAPLEVGTAVTSLGSTLAVKLLSQVRIDDPEIGLYSHKLGDFWLVGGASNTGGAVLLAHFTPEEMAELSHRMTPETSTGLGFYPLLTPGERFPVNDPSFEGILTPRPKSDVEFLQAMFEGIASVERRCYSEMVARGAAFPQSIYTAGGGAQNSVWTQIRTGQLGLEPRHARETEAAIGAARLAQHTFR